MQERICGTEVTDWPSDLWWECRQGLWWGNMRKVRWTRRRVNRMTLREWNHLRHLKVAKVHMFRCT